MIVFLILAVIIGIILVESNPCPSGSIEIAQQDIDQALPNVNNHGYMITQPGDYCLRETIVVDGNALNIRGRGGLRVITINSPGVNLNMNGNGIINVHGSKALAGSYGYGFDAINFWNPGNVRTKDVAIRNGFIQGFDNGVAFASTGGFKGVTVEGITFISNYNSLFIHEAEKVIVKDNIVRETNKGINVAGRMVGDSSNILVENNWLRGVRNRGISVSTVSGLTINNNIIDKLPSQQNNSTAIEAVDAVDLIINNNHMNNHDVGIKAYFYTGGSYSGNTWCNVNNHVEVILPAVLNDLGGNNFINAQNC